MKNEPTATLPETTDLRAANEALLRRLDEAKRAYRGPAFQHKDMLRDPAISALVNRLVLLNEPWMLACVKREKQRMGLRESVEELASTAIAGQGSWRRDVGGMMGAALKYEYGEYGVANFTLFLRKAVHDALALTPKEMRRSARVVPLDCDQDTEVRTWVDRNQRPPEEAAIGAELMRVLEQAIERLPYNRQWVARFVLDFTRDNGRGPTGLEVAGWRGVSKQRGEQLLRDAFEQLQAEIARACPDLAGDGIGGLAEFRKAFGKHKGGAGRRL